MACVDKNQSSISPKVKAASVPGQKIPELTILVPTLNEEITVDRFLDWCREGIAHSQVDAEIILIDSSTDSTPEKATAKGARVARRPAKGWAARIRKASRRFAAST